MDIQIHLNILVSCQRRRCFPISGITSIQHTNAPKHSQHYSASHLGESFTYQGLRIRFFGYVIWVLKYFIDLILLAFSILCGGELSRVAHLALQLCKLDLRLLCKLDLGLLCKTHPSCSQYSCGGEFHLSRFTHLILRLCHSDLGYLMRGRVSPIQVCVSGSLIFLFGPYSVDLLLPAFSTLCRERFTYQEVHAFQTLALLLGLPTTLHFTHLIFRLCYLVFGIRGSSHPFCFWYLM